MKYNPTMRITSIDLFQADIPLKDPFKIAVMEVRAAANVFVRINTDEGIVGWGEASPFWKLCGETRAIDMAAAVDLAKIIKDKNPLEIDDRMNEIDGYLKNNSQIRAAFDMALHDILGKAAGMPLYRLLGGSGRAMRTCLTVAIAEAEAMARKAAQAKGLGFGIVKIKLGTTVREDIDRVRKIREAVGARRSFAWTRTRDGKFQRRCPYSMRFTNSTLSIASNRSPDWNLAALKSVHDRSPIPIVADEGVFDHHDAFKVLSMDAADYVNLKLSKSGGIRCGQKVAAVVDAAGKSCMIGCMMESRLGLTAAAHLAASMSHFRFIDLDSALTSDGSDCRGDAV